MDEIVIEIIDNPQEKDIDIIKGELRKVMLDYGLIVKITIIKDI